MARCMEVDTWKALAKKRDLGDRLLVEVACLILACKLHVVTIFPLSVEPFRNL